MKTITGNRYLLDTSVLVALIDKSEEAHKLVKKTFEGLSENIFTTEAVLTEALHLLRKEKNAAKLCLDYVINDLLNLVPLDKADLSRIQTLMKKYADVPMDFADATLVVLAEELRISTVLTLDRRGFDTYRIFDSRPFTVLP